MILIPDCQIMKQAISFCILKPTTKQVSKCVYFIENECVKTLKLKEYLVL